MKYLFSVICMTLLVGCSPKPLSSNVVNAPDLGTSSEAGEYGETSLPVTTRLGKRSDEVMIESIDVLGDSLRIAGSMPGNWFFEATAPVTLLDSDGLIVAEGYVQATEEWMTVESIPFKGMIDLEPGIDLEGGSLILRRHNASGLIENDGYIEVMLEEIMYITSCVFGSLDDDMI